MGGFATHAIFGREVLKKMPDRETAAVIRRHPGVFGVGCQGPDLFLYNLPMLLGAEQKNLGVRMHRENTSRYFAWLMQGIWEAEGRMEKEVGISYLYGALAHYTLDSVLHPYIFARVGYDPAVGYARQATSGQHHRLEAAIDARMLAEKEDMLPSGYAPGKEIALSKAEQKILSRYLSEAVSRSFRIGLRRENVTASLRMMRILAWGFFAFSTGQKRFLQRLERLFLRDCGLTNFMVTDDQAGRRRVMNADKRVWRHPWKKEQTSQDSVWELFSQAVEQYEAYCRILEPAAVYFPKGGAGRSGSRDAAVKRKIYRAAKGIGNLSYESGLPVGREN